MIWGLHYFLLNRLIARSKFTTIQTLFHKIYTATFRNAKMMNNIGNPIDHKEKFNVLETKTIAD